MVLLQGTLPGPRQISLHSLALLESYSPDHEFYKIIPLGFGEDDGFLLTADDALFPADLPSAIRQVLEAHQQVLTFPRGCRHRVLSTTASIYYLTRSWSMCAPIASPIFKKMK